MTVSARDSGNRGAEPPLEIPGGLTIRRPGEAKLPLSPSVFLEMANQHEAGDEQTGVYSDIIPW